MGTSHSHAHVALNSLVPVAMSLEDGGVARDTVQSRHFAQAFTKHAGKKSELMAQFSAVSTIKTTFHGDLTRTHREFKEVIDSPIHHRGGPWFFMISLIPLFILLLVFRRMGRPRQADGHPAAAKGVP